MIPLLTMSSPCLAAEPLVHSRWGVEEGLPVASINEVAVDRTGYLWAATFDGLVRFDGTRFVVYSVETTPGLTANRFLSVRGAPDGAVVFTTESGEVGRYVPEAGTWQHALVSRLLPVVTVGPTGEVWAAAPEGIGRLEGDAIVPFGPTWTAAVGALALDGDAVWVGTDRGVARVVADGIRWWTHADGLPADLVRGLAVGDDGTIWLGTDGGPARIVHGSVEPLLVDGHPWTAPALFARPDGEGSALIGTQDGLFRWRAGQAQLVDPEDEDRAPFHRVTAGDWTITRTSLLREGTVAWRADPARLGLNALVEDGQGGVFVATGDDGLHRFAPALVHTVGTAEGLSHANAYALAASASGGVWVGTQRGGLDRVRGDRAEVVFADDGPDRNVTSVLETRSGELWIGTQDNGVFRQAPDGDWVPEGLGPTSVRALEELADGTLLAGTRDGVWRRGPDGWRSWAPPGMPEATVRAVLEAADGTLWLGTNGEGVAKIVGDRVERYGRSEGFPSDAVRSLWAAPDGVLWVGTEDHGLFAIVDPAHPTPGRTLSREEGLPDHCVHALVADGRGAVWGSTNRGLFRISLDELSGFARDGGAHVLVDRFDQRDGMADREANGGVHRSGVRATDGTIWFATQAGVVHVDPAAYRPSTPPPVVIEDLEVGGSALAVLPGGLVLEPERRTFGLTYSALAFHAPERTRFWTSVDGLSSDWIPAGDRRTAWFTELPPGDYTFRVRATPPGTPGPEASVRLSVPPTFTETWLFRALLLGLLLGLVALAVRARIRAGHQRELALEALVTSRTRALATQTAAAEEARATIAAQAAQLREVDRLKTRFFENLSHELRTPLTLVLGPLEDVRLGRLGAVPSAASEALGRAERSARRLRSLVDQLLDLVRIDVGALELAMEPRDLVALLRRVTEEFAPTAERRDLSLEVSLPDGVVAVTCDARELEKVFVNLLGNALKFTPAGGRVHLSATVDGPGVRVDVTDSGPGIPLADQAHLFDRFRSAGSSTLQAGTGIGLSLARELTERHGGTLSLRSVPGEGATFTVTLPVVGATPLPFAEPTEPATLEEPEAPSPAEDERDRVTVLVVDDEDELRGWVRSILSSRYRVIEASDGAEALRRAREELPDLVVSDVMMPELDGFGLVRAIRAEPLLDWLPVVLLTARGAAEAHVEGVTRGADVYLTKPFSSSVLLAHVGQLLAQRARLRERFAAAPAQPVEEILSADERYLRKVRAAIEARMADPTFSVEALADAVAQDRSHLFRQLKELTGEAPSTWIRTMRLERAARLLTAKAGNISEIGHACGFSSVSQFSRAFKVHFGVAPSDYRG
ncbi:MAG: response regulator [Alphaproteobacteria bacterium]|nr:response regulator [Alphaproteobacteria bacterium]